MADAVQTAITANPPVGAPGMIYDSGAFHDINSFIAEEAIPFGAYVKISGMKCELPDATGEVTGMGGIAVKDDTKPGGYVAGDLVAVMKVGRVWVLTEEAIANNASPFVRFTAATSPTRPIGGWLNTADSGKAVQPSGVTMYRGVGAAGLAVVEINRTGGGPTGAAGAAGAAGATGSAGATGPTGPTGPTG